MKTETPSFSINQLLSTIPLFSSLDEADINTIALSARRENHNKGSVIMCESDNGNSLNIVLAGMVKIYICDEDGNEHTLRMSGPNSYFGEVAMLANTPRTASAVTTETTTLVYIPKAALMKCVTKKPDIALHMLSEMAQLLQKATNDIRVLALKNTYQRLVLKLIEVSQEKNGVTALERNYSQSDLANMIGASREAVGKILLKLEQQGYIQKSGKQIVIKGSLPLNL